WELCMRDIDRIRIIRNVLDKRLTNKQAAKQLDLSKRQVIRLKHRYRRQGVAGLIHGLRGQVSNNQLKPRLGDEILQRLRQASWEGFGPTFAHEQLMKKGLRVGVATVRTIMRTTQTYLRRHGRPLVLYVDKDSIYKTSRQPTVDEELQDLYPITQYTRAMSELGIEVICAHSPQAKGRVERLFNTLQDRLVKELRLRGISTKEEANRFLQDVYIPEHNARFAIAPANTTDAHRRLLRSLVAQKTPASPAATHPWRRYKGGTQLALLNAARSIRPTS